MGEVVDAYCPECREDLRLTPEEAEEAAPSLEKIANAFEPLGVAWGCLCVVIGAISSAMVLLGCFVTRDWEAAGYGAIGLAVCGVTLAALYRRTVVKTSVTTISKFPKDEDEPK